MWRRVIVSLIIVLFSDNDAKSVVPTVNCPTLYVPEGKSLECSCQTNYTGSQPSDFSVTWPGYSNSSTLKMPNVTRADNGTVFTCLVTWGGDKKTANYTLQVAYGPDDKHTTIRGSEFFIADGKRNLSLNCEATEVHPRPNYTWDGVKCENNDTDQGICLLKPLLWDDGQKVHCTATSIASANNSGRTTFRLNLKYPPLKPPEILGYKAGQVLSAGDELHCRVSGGKPLVKKVNFSCSSDPPHEDQEDTTDGVSVQSSVTIVSYAANYSMVCVCGATWEPSEDLYTLNSNITVFVDKNKKEGTHFGELQIGIAVVIPAVLITTIICIVAVVHVKNRKRQKGLTITSTDSRQQNDVPCQTSRIPDTDYEEIVELENQEEQVSDTINKSSSKVFQGVNAFSRKKFTFFDEYGTSKSRENVHAGLFGLVSQERKEDYPTPGLGISPGRRRQMSLDTEEDLYTEIDIPVQGELAMSNEPNAIATVIVPKSTSSSSRTRAENLPDINDKVALSQDFIRSPSLNISELQKEECNVYNILQRH